MLRKFFNNFIDRVLRSRRPRLVKWFLRGIIFTAILMPALLMAGVSYVRLHQELTYMTLHRRQAVAQLSAAVLEEKFYHLIDTGLALATREEFRYLISQGRWREATELLNEVTGNFPFIERMFLADPKGTLRADMPPLPGVVGVDFSYRDWYKGVSAEWKPYISRAYQRAAVPRYNVVTVALPIRNNGSVIGIFAMQIRVERFVEWTKELHLKPSVTHFVIDQGGGLVSHPDVALQEGLIDLSSSPLIQRMFQQENGILITEDPISKQTALTAFAKISDFNWGMVVAEPTWSAFAARRQALRFVSMVYAVILFLGVVLAVLIASMLERIIRQHQLLRESEQRFRLMSDTAPVMIWMTDAAGACVFVNKPWLEFRGKGFEEECNGGWLEGAHPEDEQLSKGLMQSLRQPREFRTEYRVERGDGKYRWLRIHGAPRFTEDGDFLGFIGTCLDITQRRWGEERLEMAVLQLTEKNQELKFYNEMIIDEEEILALKQKINELSGELGRERPYDLDALKNKFKERWRKIFG